MCNTTQILPTELQLTAIVVSLLLGYEENKGYLDHKASIFGTVNLNLI
jgi:hypothetical protein